MAVPRSSILTVRPRGGKVVHSTTEGSALLGRTFCSRACSGWTLAEGRVTCQQCVEGMERWVRRRRQR